MSWWNRKFWWLNHHLSWFSWWNQSFCWKRSPFVLVKSEILVVKSPFVLVFLVKSEFLLEKITICLGETGFFFPVSQLGSTNKSRLVTGLWQINRWWFESYLYDNPNMTNIIKYFHINIQIFIWILSTNLNMNIILIIFGDESINLIYIIFSKD